MVWKTNAHAWEVRKMNFRLLKENEMFLHQDIASGTLGNDSFSVSNTLPDHSIVVKVEKKRAILNIQDITKAGIEFIKKS
jgi:hypothetical protein